MSQLSFSSFDSSLVVRDAQGHCGVDGENEMMLLCE